MPDTLGPLPVTVLRAEGYAVQLEENPSRELRSRWLVHVEPFDDGVEAMVEVYGGWLPDEAH
jgi:hypothetical protein